MKEVTHVFSKDIIEYYYLLHVYQNCSQILYIKNRLSDPNIIPVIFLNNIKFGPQQYIVRKGCK